MATKDLEMVVDPIGGGTTDPEVGVHPIEANEVVPIEAFPAPGYVFVNWTGDVDLEPSDNPNTVTMTDNEEITANFELIDYNLAFAVVGKGTLDPAAPSNPYNYEDEVEVTATPDDPLTHELWRWMVDGIRVGKENPYTLVVKGDHMLVAIFRKIQTFKFGRVGRKFEYLFNLRQPEEPV